MARRALFAAVLALVLFGDLGFVAPRAPTRRPSVARNAAASEKKLWLADARLVEAVEGLGGRVTKADLLARGVPAGGLERELLQLARASGAGLQVNQQGELLFEFPEDLSKALRKHSLGLRVQRAVQRAKPWLRWGGRVAFGVSVVSIVTLVFLTMMVISSTSSQSRDDGEGGRTTFISYNSFGLWFGPNPWFWLYPSPYDYYTYRSIDDAPPKMSFLESVFSFAFGDGDPNKQILQEQRWQQIGSVISENGGAVTAEQVAPFLDPPDKEEYDAADVQRRLSSAMLPVLLRFNGKPEVDEEGGIVYVFPDLQGSVSGEYVLGDVSTDELRQRLEAAGYDASTSSRSQIVEFYQKISQRMTRRRRSESLQEEKLRFSEADGGQIATCVALGVFALLGLLYIGGQMPHAARVARVSPIVDLTVKAYPWLLGYIAAFLAVPTIRFLRLGAKNARIAARNEWRARQAAKLRQAGDGLRRRLASAATWAKRRKVFGGAVYDTGESAGARQGRKEQDDLRAFDERLKG